MSNRDNCRRYAAAHPERVKESSRRYYMANTEHRKAYSRQWKDAHRERVRAYQHKYAAAHPERIRAYLRKALYGLTREAYEGIYKSQNGQCWICRSANLILNVDHDHLTGKVRGLLCINCNHGLGKFKENCALLERAVQYLKEKGAEKSA